MADPDQQTTSCSNCGIRFSAPKAFIEARYADARDFYCPNGHVLSWRVTEADKLRQERDRLKQRLAEKDDEIAQQRGWREHAERQVSAAKGQITKLKKRAAAGVCPCCNRSFENLRRHMTSQHPDFKDQPHDSDKVVPLKRA